MWKITRLNCRLLITAFIVGVALIGTAAAHHGWSHYDEKKTLNLTGVIRESGYGNPHGFARLQVEGERGQVWYVVLAPPARMQGRGLTREMLTVGTTATVVGYPHREKAGEMRAERITINGKTTELR
jgi:hypothetical protein